MTIAFILILYSVLYYKLANKYNIIDKPNERSSHTMPTIRGGGSLFLIAVLCSFFTSNFQNTYFIFGIVLIGLVSFLDDIITLSPKLRLPFQLLAVVLMLYQTGVFNEGVLLSLLFLIVGAGFINLYNFMDGINGITGLYSLVVLLTYYVINLKIKVVDDHLILFPILSLLVFGYYNFRKKAMMFAGDIGSICIALLIFFIGIQLFLASGSIIVLLSVVVYVSDALLTMVYRKSIGENILQAHRHHIYQKLVDKTNLTHLQVSGIYAILQLLIGGLVVLMFQSSIKQQLLILFLVSIVCILAYIGLFKFLEKKE